MQLRPRDVIVGRNEMLGETEVTNEIRRGCTEPPQHFVMIVNVIIDSVVGSRRGYRDDDYYAPVLFYEDDGLLLARACS